MLASRLARRFFPAARAWDYLLGLFEPAPRRRPRLGLESLDERRVPALYTEQFTFMPNGVPVAHGTLEVNAAAGGNYRWTYSITNDVFGEIPEVYGVRSFSAGPSPEGYAWDLQNSLGWDGDVYQ